MRNIILIVCFSYILLDTAAQVFNPFKKEYTYQFSETQAGNSYALQIEAAYKSGNDSVFIFNPAYFSTPDCSTPYSYSSLLDSNNILGQRIVQKPNQDYLFITQQKDTFLIKTVAKPNEKWFFNFTNDIIATSLGKSLKTFCGVTDSVLTIKLNVGDSIKISKKFGFVQVPMLRNNADMKHTSQLVLQAIRGTEVGSFSYAPGVLYNYMVGDKYKIDTYSRNPCDKNFTPVDNEIWKTIVGKSFLQNDTVVYTYCQSNSSDFISGISGESKVVLNNNYTAGYYLPVNYNLSNQLAFSKYGDTAIYFNAINEGILFYNFNGCLNTKYPGTLGVYYEETIAAGQGLVHQHTNIMNGCGSENGSDQVFVENEKNPAACGSTTGVVKESNTMLLVFPNPATDQLHIECSFRTKGNLYIFNATGQVVFSEMVDLAVGDLYTINTAFLPPGIYQVRISEAEKLSFKQFSKF